jgi:anti-anti-sigma regulatory factor
MTELSINVEQLPEHGAFVVRAVGPLTAWNRHFLRRAVLKCLPDMPSAVIVDLTGVHLVDRIAAAAFVAMRREAARTGPGINLLLCGVVDQLLAQRIRTLDRTQGIYATVDGAIVAIYEGPPVARWIYRPLPGGLLAAVEAGVTIVDACSSWGLSHLAYPARTAVFDLYLLARRCPPGRQSLAATCDDIHLLMSVRTIPTTDGPLACVRRRPSQGFQHKAGPTGHIVWTALPVGVDISPARW